MLNVVKWYVRLALITVLLVPTMARAEFPGAFPGQFNGGLPFQPVALGAPGLHGAPMPGFGFPGFGQQQNFNYNYSYRYSYRARYAMQGGCRKHSHHGGRGCGGWNRGCCQMARSHKRFALNLGISFGGFSFGLRIRTF